MVLLLLLFFASVYSKICDIRDTPKPALGKNGHSYYQCVAPDDGAGNLELGLWHLKSCPEGQLFSQLHRGCIAHQDPLCNNRTAVGSCDFASCDTSSSPQACDVVKDGFAHDDVDGRSFLQCFPNDFTSSCGKWYKRQCPEGSVFSKEMQVCVPDQTRSCAANEVALGSCQNAERCPGSCNNDICCYPVQPKVQGGIDKEVRRTEAERKLLYRCPSTGALTTTSCTEGCSGGQSCVNGLCCPLIACPTGVLGVAFCNPGCGPRQDCLQGVCCPTQSKAKDDKDERDAKQEKEPEDFRGPWNAETFFGHDHGSIFGPKSLGGSFESTPRRVANIANIDDLLPGYRPAADVHPPVECPGGTPPYGSCAEGERNCATGYKCHKRRCCLLYNCPDGSQADSFCGNACAGFCYKGSCCNGTLPGLGNVISVPLPGKEVSRELVIGDGLGESVGRVIPLSGRQPLSNERNPDFHVNGNRNPTLNTDQSFGDNGPRQPDRSGLGPAPRINPTQFGSGRIPTADRDIFKSTGRNRGAPETPRNENRNGDRKGEFGIDNLPQAIDRGHIIDRHTLTSAETSSQEHARGQGSRNDFRPEPRQDGFGQPRGILPDLDILPPPVRERNSRVPSDRESDGRMGERRINSGERFGRNLGPTRPPAGPPRGTPWSGEREDHRNGFRDGSARNGFENRDGFSNFDEGRNGGDTRDIIRRPDERNFDWRNNNNVVQSRKVFGQSLPDSGSENFGPERPRDQTRFDNSADRNQVQNQGFVGSQNGNNLKPDNNQSPGFGPDSGARSPGFGPPVDSIEWNELQNRETNNFPNFDNSIVASKTPPRLLPQVREFIARGGPPGHWPEPDPAQALQHSQTDAQANGGRGPPRSREDSFERGNGVRQAGRATGGQPRPHHHINDNHLRHFNQKPVFSGERSDGRKPEMAMDLPLEQDKILPRPPEDRVDVAHHVNRGPPEPPAFQKIIGFSNQRPVEAGGKDERINGRLLCPNGIPSIQLSNTGRCPADFIQYQSGCCPILDLENATPSCPESSAAIAYCSTQDECPMAATCVGATCCSTGFAGGERLRLPIPGSACDRDCAGAGVCVDGFCQCHEGHGSNGVTCVRMSERFATFSPRFARLKRRQPFMFDEQRIRHVGREVPDDSDQVFFPPLFNITRFCASDCTCTPGEVCVEGRCLLRLTPGQVGCISHRQCSTDCAASFCHFESETCRCPSSQFLLMELGLCVTRCPEGTFLQEDRCVSRSFRTTHTPNTLSNIHTCNEPPLRTCQHGF